MIRMLFAIGHALRRVWWRVSRRRTLGVRIMLHKNGRVLVIRHRYGGKLMLPGGGVDRRETVWAAARRELAEETGISNCPPLKIASVYLYLAEGRPDYVTLFVGELPDMLPPYQPMLFAEVQSVHVEIADANDDRFSPATRRRIAEIIGGSAISEWW